MTTDVPNEAQKIWAELDALDAGPPAGAAGAADEFRQEADSGAKQEPLDQTSTKEPAQAADSGATTDDRQTLLDKINGLESQVQQLLPLASRVRNVEGQYGGINSQLQALKTAKEATAAAGQDAPSATQIREAQKNPEAMARLKTDYPEFATAMEAALEERFSGVTKELAELRAKGTLTSAPSAPVLTAADLEALRSELQVDMVHPGWKDTVRKPEFAGWLSRQPREVQMLATSDSPQDAIRLLDLSKATSRQNTQRRLESAAAIPAGRAASTRSKPIEDMPPEEYWRYLDQVELQKSR